MPDDLKHYMMTQVPTPERPMLGLTVLVVEDSLYACEALRLLCLRSGARIRRADSLKSAHRHLISYRPMVAIIDLGLPDGSGAELISELANASSRVNVILGTSGDVDAKQVALNAGADGFLEKPITSLAAFQAEVLKHLPTDKRLRGPRPVNNDTISPDPMALRDDLAHISEILRTATDGDRTIAYAAQFLSGIARLADDSPLARAASDLDAHCKNGQSTSADLSKIAELVVERLQRQPVV